MNLQKNCIKSDGNTMADYWKIKTVEVVVFLGESLF